MYRHQCAVCVPKGLLDLLLTTSRSPRPKLSLNHTKTYNQDEPSLTPERLAEWPRRSVPRDDSLDQAAMTATLVGAVPLPLEQVGKRSRIRSAPSSQVVLKHSQLPHGCAGPARGRSCHTVPGVHPASKKPGWASQHQNRPGSRRLLGVTLLPRRGAISRAL